MSARPLSITIISWVFIAAGTVGLAYHATEIDVRRPFDDDALWACSVRLFAILCGVFMLRGSNWARWGIVVWLGYHVILSALHTPLALAIHSALFAIVLYFVSRPEASVYFRGATTTPQDPRSHETG